MSTPVVFFFPHQDDEFLTHGAAIQSHLAAGREVVCVSMVDGQSSGVRAQLEKEGFPLSEAAFSKARDRELLDCLSRLGVKRENIFFENLLDGGTWQAAKVKGIMKSYFELFPGGSYKTHSWMDKHRDHHVLGRALDELSRAGEVPNNDARFFRSDRYPGAPTPGGSLQPGTDPEALRYAGEAYSVWAPNRFARSSDMQSGPRYSIGYRSVGEEWFLEVAKSCNVFTHRDSSFYTAAQREDANNWLRANDLPGYL